MKNAPYIPFFSLLIILVFTGLACQTSAPVKVEHTQTAILTELPATHQSPTNTQIPTDPPPTPTATPDPAPSVFTYTLISGGLADFRDVGLEFDLRTPGLLYARGEHKASYQSTDGGATWQLEQARKVGLPYDKFRDAGIFSVHRDPHNPTTLYGLSEPLQSFVRSVDDGENWVSFSIPFSVYSIILEIDPRTPDTLFVANEFSIYKSTDGGETWMTINEGLPEHRVSPFYQQQFIFDPAQPKIIYFLDRGVGGSGLYQSINGGDKWQRIDLPALNIGDLIIDPQDSNRVYVSDSDGFYKSVDTGRTWQLDRLGLPGEANIQSLAIDPSTPTIWYAILQEGTGKLYKSEDAGQTWNELQPIGFNVVAIEQLAVDPQTPGILYAADKYHEGTVFKSADNGRSWQPIFRPEHANPDYPNYIYKDSVVSVFINPQIPTTLYAASPYVVYKSTDGGQTWKDIYQDDFIYAVVLSPSDPGILYIVKASNGAATLQSKDTSGVEVWTIELGFPQTVRSIDGEQTWQAMGTLELGEKENFTWLAADPQNPSMLYAAFSAWVDNNTRYAFYKSTDAGQTWQPANFGLPEDSYVTHFMVDPHTSTTLFAVNHGMIYKSTDDGQTWNTAGTDLPDGQVTAMVIDPARPTTLYAAISDYGVYRSLDGGENWAAVNPEPFTIPINILILDLTTPNTLYLGTANGVWVLRPGR